MKVDEIGSSMKRIRKDQKLSQFDLAELLYTTPAHISNIERTSSHLSVMMFFSIFEALGYEIDIRKKSDV